MKDKQNVTLFICDHCNKKYQVKNACIEHEKWCSKNPDNAIACVGCIHLEEYQKEVCFDTYVGESSKMIKAFRCNAKNIGLYPLKVVRTNTMRNYPDAFEGEELFPKECDLYQYFF